MKKRSLLALPLLALTLASVSCGGSGDNFKDPSYKPFEGTNGTDITAEITFWHTMNEEMRNKFVEPTIKQFNEIYPNIKVNHEPQGGYDDIKDKIQKAIPAGTTPSLAVCYPDHVAEYINKPNGAIRLDGYMKDPKIGFGTFPGENGEVITTTSDHTNYSAIDDMFPNYLEEGTFSFTEGHYSVPFYKSSEALFYNATVFEEKGYEVPKTWDEMIALAKQMVKDFPDRFGPDAAAAHDANGKFKQAPIGYDSEDNMFISFSEMLGAPYTEPDNGNEVKFNNKKSKDMVKMIDDWYNQGLIVCKGVLPNNAYTSTIFTEENCLMSIGSTGGVKHNVTQNFETKVAPLPSLNGKSKFISQGPSICLFDKKENEKQAAWLFYKFMTDKTHSAMSASLSGYSPVRKSSFETDIYKNVVAKGNQTVDETTNNSQRITILTGKTFGVYDEYIKNDSLFTSTVFKGSAKTRTEVGKIIVDVLLNDEEIDKAYKKAIDNIILDVGDSK